MKTDDMEGGGIDALLERLQGAGIHLEACGDRLKVSGRRGALTPLLQAELLRNKEELLALLRAQAPPACAAPRPPRALPAASVPDPAFAPAAMQQAYWIGSGAYQYLGGIRPHYYTELDQPGLDPGAAELALNRLVARHGMLRAVFETDGRLRMLDTVPYYAMETADLRGAPRRERARRVRAWRDGMSHGAAIGDAWPPFAVRAALLDGGRTRLFVSLSMLIADAASILLFFDEWRRLIAGGTLPAAPASSFRDYLEQARNAHDEAQYRRARDYWLARLDRLPGPPALPLAQSPRALRQPRFIRRGAALAPAQWEAFRHSCRRHGVTPSVAVLTAFADVLRAWSDEPDFTLNLTTDARRDDLVPEARRMIGVFSSTCLLEVRMQPDLPFAARAAALQAQLLLDLDHAAFGGVEVLRERARRAGSGADTAMPVVFTSLIGLGAQEQDMAARLDQVHASSQTPQVWLDCQAMESGGGLQLNWDTVDAVLPARLPGDMFAACAGHLRRLADDARAWEEAGLRPRLPAWQEQLIARTNATRMELAPLPLHLLVAPRYTQQPQAPAVIAADRCLSYGELGDLVQRLARRLHARGARRGELVAIVLDKGWRQVVAALAVLHTGAAWVALDPRWPRQRRLGLLRKGRVRLAVTGPGKYADDDWDRACALVGIDDAEMLSTDPAPLQVAVRPGDLAYVMFTSGSSGAPKGVMIEHGSASNTVQYVNARIGAGPADRMLALSALHFDLSVYDIFGVLGAGGTLVIPDAARAADPAHWTALMRRHRVTLWNSVPQLLQAWVRHAPAGGAGFPDLRMAILSGDWIPLTLPEQARALCPRLRLLGAGGATETSIWCIGHEIGSVRPEWNSIPYGKPFANHTVHVLDARGEPRPVWVSGELYAGGMAPARGYLDEPGLTARSFVVHPRSGERLYRTGDYGRRLPDGSIEFLGRADGQFKRNGVRIEPGEIEAALRREPAVLQAVVRPAANGMLAAYLVLRDGTRKLPPGLRRRLAAALPQAMLPEALIAVDALPLTDNGKLDVAALPLPGQADGGAGDGAPPRTPWEEVLFRLVAAVAGRGDFGMRHSLRAAGVDSLAMQVLAGRIAAHCRLPEAARPALLRAMWEARDLAALAREVARQAAQRSGGDPEDAVPVLRHDAARLHEPFAPADLQLAYLAGEGAQMEYHVRATLCLQLELDGAVDAARLQQAFNGALARQARNLCVFDRDLRLRVTREAPVPRWEPAADLRALDREAARAALAGRRERMRQRVPPLDAWPWMACALSIGRERAWLHLAVCNHFIDARSLHVLLRDAMRLYRMPAAALPPLAVCYRDYMLAHHAMAAGAQGSAAAAYWQARIARLPLPPALPTAAAVEPAQPARLVRHAWRVAPQRWAAFQRCARAWKVAPATALYAVYAEVLARWSGSRHFVLGHMQARRLPLHPQVDELLGCFGTVMPLEADWRGRRPFGRRARGLQRQLDRDAPHAWLGGARVWPRINREHGSPWRAPAPFVVASMLDLPPLEHWPEISLQTPQVLFDHQLHHLADGTLVLTLDVNQDRLPPGLAADVIAAHQRLLALLCDDPLAWERSGFDLLPESARALAQAANATAAPLPDGLLDHALDAAAARYPDKPAVVCGDEVLGYACLRRRAHVLARRLRALGLGRGDLVPILLDKSVEQAVAVYGILACGAAFVPLDPAWPAARLGRLLQDTRARALVCGRGRLPCGLPQQVLPVRIEAAEDEEEAPAAPRPPRRSGADLAYVIYTSGSAGEPKGVMIAHRSAGNTVADVNRRFGIGPDDVLLGVSPLWFDLALYDLFGSVAAGATLVLPAPADVHSPCAWLRSLRRHRVSIWNSVPVLAQLLADSAAAGALESLRLVLLSGDWIAPPLAAQLADQAPRARLIALGGATEASIWSIFHAVTPADFGRRSIPYGMPLANQRWLVLDELGQEAPPWSVGHLHIAGAGLARGYLRDRARTRAAFRHDAGRGERLYRTGDLGRRLPDGTIELLGRADQQLKLRGYRVEPGEIEHALRRQARVRSAAVLQHEGRLLAFVTGDGIAPEELRRALREQLPAQLVPDRVIALARLPASANGKLDRKALAAFAAQDVRGEQAAAGRCSPLEGELAALWAEVLGAAPPGLDTDFIAAGGNSLDAIRLLARIRQRYGRELAPAVLLSGGSVAALARALQAALDHHP